MNRAAQHASTTICTCDHISPPERVLRSPEFNGNLAQFYKDLGHSGDGTVDFVLTELYDHRTGRLIGPDGKEIPIEAEEGTDTTVFDNLFGEDQRRFINRYRDKAERPPKNRLDRRCVIAVTVLHFARQIHLCRTQGDCNR